jgi:hypothetical protein
MKNIFASLFRSVLNSFRNQSRAPMRANAPSLTPEQFRDMFTQMLAEPETRKMMFRSMALSVLAQGGACGTLADSIGAALFGNACSPADTGNYNFPSNIGIGIGTTAPSYAVDAKSASVDQGQVHEYGQQSRRHRGGQRSRYAAMRIVTTE